MSIMDNKIRINLCAPKWDVGITNFLILDHGIGPSGVIQIKNRVSGK